MLVEQIDLGIAKMETISFLQVGTEELEHILDKEEQMHFRPTVIYQSSNT